MTPAPTGTERVYESLADWCVECDDVFCDEVDPDEASCVEQGHRRAFDPKHDLEWVICDRCRGEGTLGGWPGAYTESDRADWSDEDYDDYRETRRPCEDCGGSGKTRELTEEAAARPIVQEWLNDHYDYLAEMAAERRMGA